MKNLHFKKNFTALAAITMTFGVLPSLAAETMNLNGINSNYVQQESVTYNGNTATDYVGTVTGTLNGDMTQFFFCYDLTNSITVPGNYQVNTFSPTASFPSYLGLPNTFNLQTATSLLNSINLNSLTNVNQFIGLQSAIWSILYNWTSTSQSTNPNGAHFSSSTLSGAALTYAETYLANAETLINSPNFGDWQILVNANDSPGNVTQTLVGMDPPINAPEPQTYLVLGSFLLLACFCYNCKKHNVCA